MWLINRFWTHSNQLIDDICLFTRPERCCESSSGAWCVYWTWKYYPQNCDSVGRICWLVFMWAPQSLLGESDLIVAFILDLLLRNSIWTVIGVSSSTRQLKLFLIGFSHRKKYLLEVITELPYITPMRDYLHIRDYLNYHNKKVHLSL